MGAAAGRVAQRDVLRTCDAHELARVALGGDIELHLLRQLGLRVVEHPEPAQGVLHHVAHDPLGREQLRGRADLLGRGLLALLEASEGVVLLTCDVELVEPAHHLALIVDAPVGIGLLAAPQLLGDLAHHAAHKAALTQEVARQQQRLGGAHAAEEARHELGQLRALGHEQQAEQLLIVRAVGEVQHLLRVEPGQVERAGLGQALGASPRT